MRETGIRSLSASHGESLAYRLPPCRPSRQRGRWALGAPTCAREKRCVRLRRSGSQLVVVLSKAPPSSPVTRAAAHQNGWYKAKEMKNTCEGERARQLSPPIL